jgi:hypothetical protein
MPNINFPSSLDTDITLFNPFNRYRWTSYLKAAVTDVATVLILTDTAEIPSYVAGNYIGVENEIMYVDSVDNTDVNNRKLNVTRGKGYSTAVEHDASLEVVQCHTAELHNQLKAAIIAIETYVLANVPTPITQAINATPYTYNFTGELGYKYKLTVSVENSDNSQATIKSFTVIQWNIAGRAPQYYEGELITEGTELDIQLANLIADNTNFDIIVTGANGGFMKVSVTEKVAI